jgi:hypothetical protein
MNNQSIHMMDVTTTQVGLRRGDYKLVWGGAAMMKKEEGPYGKSNLKR